VNVIIIDDQKDVVRGIVNGINWKRMQIDHVFTAHSLPEARQVFAQNHIDLMLCDIEMPMGSGLEVLRWVRECGYQAQCIFLTSHANFEYARSAITLGSFDYILQPAKYDELANAIQRAIQKIHNEKLKGELSDYGSYWRENQEMLLDTTLKQILTDRWESVWSRRIDFSQIRAGMTPDTVLFPVLISILRQQTPLDYWDSASLAYAMENMLREVLGRDCEVLHTGEGEYTAVVFPLAEDEDDQTFQAYLMEFRNACEHYLHCVAACYMGNFTPLSHLHDSYLQLQVSAKDNVARYGKVFPPTGSKNGGFDLHPLERPKVWMDYYKRHWYTQADIEMEEYLMKLVEDQQITAELLHGFHQDFLKVFYAEADTLGIDAQNLFSREEYSRYANAPNSVEDMLHLIHHATTILVNASSSENRDNENMHAKIVKYIEEHLDREISRNELAQLVNISPEHLSRQFKKEMGLSLSDYIIQEKMNMARYLLRESNLSVSVIASKVGYTSFSHFSQLFKRVIGTTPMEYRKTVRQS